MLEEKKKATKIHIGDIRKYEPFYLSIPYKARCSTRPVFNVGRLELLSSGKN